MSTRTDHYIPAPVAAGAFILPNDLVIVDGATGLATGARDLLAHTFLGYAYRGLDNTSGASGVIEANHAERYAELTNGHLPVDLLAGSTPVLGAWVYAITDAEATAAGVEAAKVARTVKTTAGNLKVGKLIKPDPGSADWIIDTRPGYFA